MKKLRYILLAAVALLCVSCVYDYPVYIPAGTQLKLTFKLDSSVLKSYPQMNDISSEDYDLRYVIKAYRKTSSGNLTGTPHKEFVFTKDDIASLDSTFLVELDEGNYTFYTVTDYVPQYFMGDNHFNTVSFADLYLRCDEYHGSTESKTLYAGIQDAHIERFNGQETSADTISLTPVLFKYQIVATDLEKFYRSTLPSVENGPDFGELYLKDYYVKVRYDEKEPLYTHMDVFGGCKPTKGVAGLSFTSKLTKLNDNEAMLCYDHVMVGADQKELKLKVGIYKKDGTHITTIPVKFPVHTGKFQCVKGDFMTYIGLENPEDGGVVVNPNFNGNIDINN